MSNISLVGSIQAEIDHVFGVTISDLSFNGDRPVTVKFGAQGAIGSSKGQEKVSGSFKLAVPATGMEFDIAALMAKPGGFTVTFPIGSERHQLYGCQVTKRSLTNNPEGGNSEFSLEFTATEWVRVS